MKAEISLNKTDCELKIDIREIDHPEFDNRKLSILYINDKLDLPALSFLLEESRTGGRHGLKAGKTTHINRAYRIGELYGYLYRMFKMDWRQAKELHCKMIRNSMMCVDMKGKLDLKHYAGQLPVENDTVNLKLSAWWKFFKHQEKMNEKMIIDLIPKWVPVRKEDSYFQHTWGISHGQNIEMKQVWRLRVKPSAKKLHYPALMENEFKSLRNQLSKQSVTIETLALLMVKTGLRVRAALEFDKKYLKNWMKYVGVGGKEFIGRIPFEYINKGADNELTKGYIPINTIEEITHTYLNSKVYNDMLYRWQMENDSDEEPLWLLEIDNKVKKLTYDHVKKAFQRASKAMGRTAKIDKITSHHLRHTFATWYLLDKIEKGDLLISTIGDEVPEIIVNLLSSLMGHASKESTFRYLATAFKILHMQTEDDRDLSVTLTIYEIETNKGVQAILRAEAIAEFGDTFEETLFAPIEYAIHSGYNVKRD